MEGKLPGKSGNVKRKKMSATISKVMVVAAADARAILDAEVTDGDAEDVEDAVDEVATIMKTMII
jgi:hypothetical protein